MFLKIVQRVSKSKGLIDLDHMLIMSKSDILLSSINTFYTDEKNKTKLLNILDKTTGISLRNLEWFITNYAKKNNTSYTTKDGKFFTVHCAYKSSSRWIQ